MRERDEGAAVHAHDIKTQMYIRLRDFECMVGLFRGLVEQMSVSRESTICLNA